MTKRESNEVEYNTKKIFLVDNKWINRIKKLALKNKSKKFRTCVHYSKKDLIHEMIVVHTKNTYVRPHKHNYKSESMFVIEGKATVITFNKYGEILNFWKIGDQKSGLTFFYKMEKNIFHTFIFHTKYFVFKETTKGPFKKWQTTFPIWAPSGKNKLDVFQYLNNLKKKL